MSGKLMGLVFELVLNRAEREVLLALCDHARDNGTGARPGVRLLAHKTDLSTRQVERKLKSLRERGVITQVGGGGHGKAAEYLIDLSKAERKPPFSRSQSNDTQMSSESNQSHDISPLIRRHPETNQTTYSAHSDDTYKSSPTSTEPSNNNREQVVALKSKHSSEVIHDFIKYRMNKGYVVHSIRGLTNKLIETGDADDDIDEFINKAQPHPMKKSMKAQMLEERGKLS